MGGPLALAMSPLFQVAYVMPDLEAGIEHCARILGVTKFLTLRDIAFEESLCHGRPSAGRQHLAFGFSGFGNIEIIQPMSGESIYTEFLLEHPSGGFHHVGYKVSDYEAARRHMRRDFTEIQSGRFGADTRFAYFDTRDALGHVTELLHFDHDTEALFERLESGEASGMV